MITHIKPAIDCDTSFYVGSRIGNDEKGETLTTSFILGLSLDGDHVRLLGPGRSDLDEGKLAWASNVARQVARELREDRQVLVLRGCVTWSGEAATLEVKRADVHVCPARVSGVERAVRNAPTKLAARMQALAETAWRRWAAQTGAACGLPDVVKVTVPAVPEAQVQVELDDDGLLMPEDWTLNVA
ncbi:hypothetical protein [Deinococcus alpinitundrae]|uniref:hypothetical protein n=1 Tax=Deinococcus alpinitundrae TaxID=468913 RepID=UPI0013796AB6|nr:hypothetical protein [Deinococcus alpinitundrae]